MVCINANSAMNPVFQGNGKLCINVLNHEQEEMARHFAGMTGMTMDDRFGLSGWQKGALGQPVLKAISNQYFTLGLFNGLAIVGIAILFDRISQAWGKRLQKHRGGGHV